MERALARRSVGVGLAALALGAGVLLLAFWILLTPVDDPTGCSSPPPRSAYADALLPVHGLVACLLAGSLALSSAAQQAARSPSAPTLGALAACVAAVVVALTVDGAGFLLLAAATFAGLLVAPLFLLAGLVRAVLARRRDAAPTDWESLATGVRVGLWVALVAVVPAHYGLAWSEAGGQVFCF